MKIAISYLLLICGMTSAAHASDCGCGPKEDPKPTEESQTPVNEKCKCGK